LLLPRLPPRSTPFPYTTLFRSPRALGILLRQIAHVDRFLGSDARLVERHPEDPRIGLPHAHLGGDHDEIDEAGQAETVADRFERSEEHTSELQSPYDLVCRLLL